MNPAVFSKMLARLAEMEGAIGVTKATKAAEAAKTAKAAEGVNPALQRTFNLQVHAPAGEALGPMMDSVHADMLNQATPLFRRKSLSDLSQGKLGTVHDVQKTGAAAGWKKSRDLRLQTEPDTFGGHPIYGSMTTDVTAPTRARLSTNGKTDVIKPDIAVSQYGPYGYVPKDKSKLTYTLGDSLDSLPGGPLVDATSPAHLYGGHYDDNALGSLANYYHGMRDDEAIKLNLPKYQGEFFGRDLPEELRKLPWNHPDVKMFRDAARLEWDDFSDMYPSRFGPIAQHLGLGGVGKHDYEYSQQMPRLIPRTFGTDGMPLSPMEDQSLGDLTKHISGSSPYGYVEVQGHGMTPADIDHVVDYSLTPSSTTEKKLKKLGMGYNPVVPADSDMSKLRDAINSGANNASVRDMATDLGQESLAKEFGFRANNAKLKDVPPTIGDHYAQGGSVSEPSEAQIKAGNYPKGHIYAHGLRISIENPADSFRSGKSKDGEEWSTRMQHDYGYIRGTEGNDGDHVDVFLGPEYKDPKHPVHVVNQHDSDTHAFDEHKVMMGFPDEDSAMEAYHGNYPDGWTGAHSVSAMPIAEFKSWLASGKTKAPVQRFANGGYVSQDQQDAASRAGVEHSNKVMKHMVRGWAAGTLGLPSSLTTLAKSIVGLGATEGSPVSNWTKSDNALPTEDFFKEWLPGASEDPRMHAAEDVGSLFGGVGAGKLLSGAGKLLEKPTTALVKHAGEAINAGMHGEGTLSKVLAPAQPLYAIKPKGGNWSSSPTREWSSVVDHTDFGTNHDKPVQDWRDKQLRRYVENQMGTVDDPLLALEKQGRLHISHQQLEQANDQTGMNYDPYRSSKNAQGMFTEYGLPQASPASAETNAFHLKATGRDYRTPWENASDAAYRPYTTTNPADEAAALKEFGTWPANGDYPSDGMSIADFAASHPDNADLAKHAWLDKADPQTKIYTHNEYPKEHLGFDHVLDYLQDATTAGIGLDWHGSLAKMQEAATTALPGAPIHNAINMVQRGLHLSPDQVGRTSVSDAVSKTHDWNKMMEEIGSKTKRMAADAVPVRKDYGDGFRWLSPGDLKGEGAAHADWASNVGKEGAWCTKDNGCFTYGSGDNGRLHVLVNKENKPLVQIHEAPGKVDSAYMRTLPHPPTEDMFGGSLTLHDYVNSKRAGNGDYEDFAGKVLDEFGHAKPPPRLTQIKGFANGKPAAEAMPYVQDFVKSGQWGDVRDLGNTDLVFDPATKAYVPKPDGYASGGLVSPALDPLGGKQWGYMDNAPQQSVTTDEFKLPMVPTTVGGSRTYNPIIDGQRVQNPDGTPGARMQSPAGTINTLSNLAGTIAGLTKDRTLGNIAGVTGALSGAAYGQYGSLGSMLGGMATKTTAGSLLGGLAGTALSDGTTNWSKVLSNMAISQVPVVGQLYGIGNLFSGGELSNSLLGRDATFSKDGTYTPSQPGWMGDFGLSRGSDLMGTPQVQNNTDPIGAFTAIMGGYGAPSDSTGNGGMSFSPSNTGFGGSTSFGGSNSDVGGMSFSPSNTGFGGSTSFGFV
jgi:hypothetical protein